MKYVQYTLLALSLISASSSFCMIITQKARFLSEEELSHASLGEAKKSNAQLVQLEGIDQFRQQCCELCLS